MSGYAPLYRLLAGCYLAPPDAELLELAAELPELAAHRAEPELAQRYSWLFDFNVYPYASVFVDPSGMLQAPWSSFVGDVLGALGMGLSSDAGLAAPDQSCCYAPWAASLSRGFAPVAEGVLLLCYLALEGPQERHHLAELFWQGAVRCVVAPISLRPCPASANSSEAVSKRTPSRCGRPSRVMLVRS